LGYAKLKDILHSLKRNEKKYKHFLELFYQARVNSGFRQIDLAQIFEMPQSFISKIESGERRIDIIEFIEICEALNISPEEFIKTLTKKINETK
jgi:transcriptional regulator with XRE-family HTH domain